MILNIFVLVCVIAQSIFRVDIGLAKITSSTEGWNNTQSTRMLPRWKKR
jgi:hypothetical protein